MFLHRNLEYHFSNIFICFIIYLLLVYTTYEILKRQSNRHAVWNFERKNRSDILNLTWHSHSMQLQVHEGPSIKDVGQFLQFLIPTPLRRQFFTTIRQQFWPIFDPFPPPNCRRCLWTAPEDKKEKLLHWFLVMRSKCMIQWVVIFL